MTSVLYAVICLFIIVPVSAQFEGERCRMKHTNERGRCVPLDKCDHAKQQLKANQRPQNCGFIRFIPIVCCPLTQKPVGQESQKQCELYYPKPVLNLRRLVFGGTPSLAKEFPHMAILGYGDQNDIQWLCGGSLISDTFVLTAAHCVDSQEFGTVKWVRLGDLDIKNTTDDARPQDFSVAKTIIHPQYRPNSHYHDIALIKLDRAAKFDEYVKPACLYANWTITEQLIATGWGKLEFFGESSSHLMKVDLNYIEYKDCARTYSDADRQLRNGIIDQMQICAGDPDGKDTCPGDSGGPLQFKVTTAPPHFYIVGITSFGRACGVENSVGVYTRVAQYIEWIEDIVWPSG